MLQWFLLGMLAVSAPAVDIHTVDNQTVSGELTELSATGATLQTAEKPVTVRLNQIFSLVPHAPVEKVDLHPAVVVELIDGSRLLGKDYVVAKRSGKLTINDSETADIAPRAVHYVRFGTPDPKTDVLWAEALKAKSANDMLVVRKKETLNFLEGTVGNLGPDTVEFELDKEPLEVKRARVDGVIFAVPAKDLPDPICAFDDSYGWRLNAKSVTFADGQFKITTPAGVTLSRSPNQLVKIDYSSGKVRYLSDLDWESAVQVPFLNFGTTSQSAFNQPRRDRAFESDKLRLGGKTYAKGLCVKSQTTIIYRLPSGIHAFKATIGIDDSMQGAGNARLIISGDNKTLFDEPVVGGAAPRDIDLNLTGASRLKIVVDYGENQDVGDHLDFCEARIQK
ncbi:MAG TPA: NPCBM/NEW2 domain-containing protein [Pirellulales bacterium]|jgi:hypothetical protein|nr:NPCBM/NEW2 domain-containing protein [Pirellulales bacterium]